MENKKQTSIEWFAKMLAEQGLLVTRDYENLITYREAKQMHKEEIEDAYGDGINAYRVDFCNREKYYQKTYGGNNKSCEHISYRAGHSPFVPSICNDCGEEL